MSEHGEHLHKDARRRRAFRPIGRRGPQNDPICASQRVIAEERPAFQNGGYRALGLAVWLRSVTLLLAFACIDASGQAGRVLVAAACASR
jgi:hypothetical protein